MYKKRFESFLSFKLNNSTYNKPDKAICGQTLTKSASDLTMGHGGGAHENTIIVRNNDWGND